MTNNAFDTIKKTLDAHIRMINQIEQERQSLIQAMITDSATAFDAMTTCKDATDFMACQSTFVEQIGHHLTQSAHTYATLLAEAHQSYTALWEDHTTAPHKTADNTQDRTAARKPNAATERTALITGGIGGIGSAICKGFLDKDYRVIANYHPAEQEKAHAWLSTRKSEGYDKIWIVPGDVASFKSCEAMAAQIRKEIGTIDTLVNCAGVTRDKTLRKMPPQIWDDVIQIDLTGIYNVTKQFIEDMAQNKFGRIVSISSVNGQKGQFGQTNYSAAKAGVHGFTMALAQEMAHKNVTVNTVSPGYVETEMTVGQMNPEILEQIVSHVPMGRMAQPEEVAYAVLMLCDEKASYISGTNLGVNGGFFMSF